MTAFYTQEQEHWDHEATCIRTTADEHAAWHIETGTPSGEYGGSCPWDSCGWGREADYARELAEEEDARWRAENPEEAAASDARWAAHEAAELDLEPPF